MAINATELKLLLGLMARLPRQPRLLMLGYPDLLVTPESIELTGLALRWDDLPKRKDNTKAVWTSHGRPQLSSLPMIETKALFAQLGARVKVVDAIQWGNVDYVANLGRPMSWLMRRELGKFDLIIDPCTPCHCFDVAQAFQNIDALLAPGAIVYHQAPASFPNHGFWSISPTALFDWYQWRGYELGRVYRFDEILDQDGFVPRLKECEPFKLMPNPGTQIVCIYAFRKSSIVGRLQRIGHTHEDQYSWRTVLRKLRHYRRASGPFPIQRCYSGLDQQVPLADLLPVPELLTIR
jgi:SAM-dependent methyltransferase